jgi:hypothetical protein
MVGGSVLTLSGTSLGSGSSDVQDVSVAGVSVGAVTWQSSTRVVVQTAAGSAGSGAVSIRTSSFDTGNFSSFTYNQRAYGVVARLSPC